jgi:hypothetical protein
MNIAESIPHSTAIEIASRRRVALAMDITIHHFACLCEENLIQVDFRGENMSITHSETIELTFDKSTPINLIRWQIQHRILSVVRSFRDIDIIESDILMVSRVRKIEIKFLSLDYSLIISL